MKSARGLLSVVLMFGVALTGFLSVGVPRAEALTTVRSSSINQSSSNFTPSVSAPTGTTAGDLVIVVVIVNGGTTISDNNGSTPFTADLDSFTAGVVGDTGLTASIYSRRIQAGDPSTYNFSVGADVDATRWSVIAVTFQNPDPTTIYDVAPNLSNAVNDISGTATGASDPSITTLTDNAINIAFMAADSGGTAFTTTPSGYTALQSSAETGVVAYTTISPAGATGSQAFAWNSGGEAYVGLQFAIKSSTAAAVPARTMRLFEGFKIKLLSGRLKLLPMQ